MAHSIHNIKGFTLVEVLVSLFVMSIGLLGLAALQGTSLAFNTDSYSRTQATLIAYEMAEKMRSNPTGVSNGNYDVIDATTASSKIGTYNSCSTGTCKCDGVGASCDSANLALYDLGTWYAKMGGPQLITGAAPQVLPGAGDTARLATIQRTSSNLVTITIRWLERDVPVSQRWDMQL